MWQLSNYWPNQFQNNLNLTWPSNTAGISLDSRLEYSKITHRFAKVSPFTWFLCWKLPIDTDFIHFSSVEEGTCAAMADVFWDRWQKFFQNCFSRLGVSSFLAEISCIVSHSHGTLPKSWQIGLLKPHTAPYHRGTWKFIHYRSLLPWVWRETGDAQELPEVRE